MSMKRKDSGPSNSACGSFHRNPDFNGFETVKNSNGKRKIATSCPALLCDRSKKVRMPSNKNGSSSLVIKKPTSCARTSSASVAGKTTISKTVKRVSSSSSSTYSARFRAAVCDILGHDSTTTNSSPKPEVASTSSLTVAGDNLEPALKSCQQHRKKRNRFSEDKHDSSDQVRKRGRVVPIRGGGSQVSEVRQTCALEPKMNGAKRCETLIRIAPQEDTGTELYKALFSPCEQDCSDQVRKGGGIYRKFIVPVIGGSSQVSEVRRSSEKRTRIAPPKATKTDLHKAFFDSFEHDDSHRTNPEVPALCSRAEYVKREREAARVSLAKMKKTSGFDDNVATVKELQALCGSRPLKHPLMALGLILKE